MQKKSRRPPEKYSHIGLPAQKHIAQATIVRNRAEAFTVRSET